MFILNKQDLCRLIPHDSNMCLLDAVTRWDNDTITCTSATHHDPNNPLHSQGRMHAICGVEYAAQAMAVHGGLISSAQNERPSLGYLAAIRNLTLYIQRLDNIKEDLIIEAKRMMGDETTCIYEFSMHSGGINLIAGRASAIRLRGKEPA
jgi:predicted hotdog family 3-hydroxylacyl-ACP dehydratase